MATVIVALIAFSVSARGRGRSVGLRWHGHWSGPLRRRLRSCLRIPLRPVCTLHGGCVWPSVWRLGEVRLLCYGYVVFGARDKTAVSGCRQTVRRTRGGRISVHTPAKAVVGGEKDDFGEVVGVDGEGVGCLRSALRTIKRPTTSSLTRAYTYLLSSVITQTVPQMKMNIVYSTDTRASQIHGVWEREEWTTSTNRRQRASRSTEMFPRTAPLSQGQTWHRRFGVL